MYWRGERNDLHDRCVWLEIAFAVDMLSGVDPSLVGWRGSIGIGANLHHFTTIDRLS